MYRLWFTTSMPLHIQLAPLLGLTSPKKSKNDILISEAGVLVVWFFSVVELLTFERCGVSLALELSATCDSFFSFFTLTTNKRNTFPKPGNAYILPSETRLSTLSKRCLWKLLIIILELRNFLSTEELYLYVMCKLRYSSRWTEWNNP